MSKQATLSLKDIQKLCGAKLACYVLITCTEPSDGGEMDVELKFEGDEHLAGLMIENAYQVFSERK